MFINPFLSEAEKRQRTIEMFENGNPIVRMGHLGVHPSKLHEFQDTKTGGAVGLALRVFFKAL